MVVLYIVSAERPVHVSDLKRSWKKPAPRQDIFSKLECQFMQVSIACIPDTSCKYYTSKKIDKDKC